MTTAAERVRAKPSQQQPASQSSKQGQSFQQPAIRRYCTPPAAFFVLRTTVAGRMSTSFRLNVVLGESRSSNAAATSGVGGGNDDDDEGDRRLLKRKERIRRLNETGDCVVATSARSARLSLRPSQQQEHSRAATAPASPRYAAIFLPSNIVEAATKEYRRRHPGASGTASGGETGDGDGDERISLSDVIVVPQSSERHRELSRSILSMTHPFLAQNFVLKAVIKTTSSSSSDDFNLDKKDESPAKAATAADLVLLDLSHTPPAAISDLLDVFTNDGGGGGSANGQKRQQHLQLVHAADNAVLVMVFVSELHFLGGDGEEGDEEDENDDGTSKKPPARKPPATDEKPASVIRISETTTASDNLPGFSSFDLPTCPVCLFRIDPARLGLPKTPISNQCSKFCPPPNLLVPPSADDRDGCPRQRLLRPWPPPSRCACCRVIDGYWKEKTGTSASSEAETTSGVATTTSASAATATLLPATTSHEGMSDLFCYRCAMQETLWVCMTCGFVGCGRYSNKHAAEHFQESGHPFSLELATLRIWEYVTGEFAHRPDLLECPSSLPRWHQWMRLTAASSASLSASLPSLSRGISGGAVSAAAAALANDRNAASDALWSPAAGALDDARTSTDVAAASGSIPSVDEKSPKKATMIGEEYEALLQSALEEQAQHYEGEITRMLATLTAEHVDPSSMTHAEKITVDNLRAEIDKLRSSIERVSRELLDGQAQEAGHRTTSQRLLREQQVSQELLKKIREETAREQEERRHQIEELEQQIADLTANQQMRDQFSQDEELSNAQISGVASTPQPARSSAKNAKKTRRGLFRKS